MSFDVNKVDGASHFQALMAFLLSDSSSPTLGTLEQAIKKKNISQKRTTMQILDGHAIVPSTYKM